MKKIDDKYKKLSDVEHVLHRPSMYLGSMKPNLSTKWIVGTDTFIKKQLTYIPAFIKLLDEIITNSIDESKRSGSKLNIIKTNIDGNKITIYDNGGIDVVKNKDDEWIPEMVFSNLRAGSNFSDDQNRTWAGTNGVGSSCVNIFSKEFNISTCDGKNKFTQTFSDNMSKRTNPDVKKSKTNHTEISFIPDYDKFNLTKIDDDHFKLIEKRIYDLAACNPNVDFYFNSTKINIKSFNDYIQMHKEEFFYEENKEKTWSIGVAHSDIGFQQVSFCNSTETYDGGTHVEYIINQIISHIREFFTKKYKVDIRPNDIRNHIFLFINSTVINPSFSSQTKEKLITEVKSFGYEYEISKKTIQSILKSEIVKSILDWIEQKKRADESRLERNLNRAVDKTKVDKLIDAKGKDRWKYSLGIFEGDCLEENTLVRVLREGELLDVKIKNININDLVITHNNSFSNIYAFTKKIKLKSIIKLKNNEELISSRSHKWFVYDVEKNEFYFEKTQNINKIKHKIVKNYLAFTESLLVIEYNDGYLLKLLSGDIINTNPDHKFAIYDKEINKFLMCKTCDIKEDKHYLVNIFKL